MAEKLTKENYSWREKLKKKICRKAKIDIWTGGPVQRPFWEGMFLFSDLWRISQAALQSHTLLLAVRQRGGVLWLYL